MGISNFSLEFDLNAEEAKKINKMYFKNLYRQRVQVFLGFFLILIVFCDFFAVDDSNDLTIWIIWHMFFIAVFFMFQHQFVNTVCKLIFRFIKKLLTFEKFITKYKFNFTSSCIYVHSPLGKFVHKWTQVEKAILTKDFFFLYVKERNGYIISISNKNHSKSMSELIEFIESNVMYITKI